MKRIFRALSGIVDGRDLILIVGLATLFVGLWLMYPPAALVAVGGFLLLAWAATSDVLRRRSEG